MPTGAAPVPPAMKSKDPKKRPGLRLDNLNDETNGARRWGAGKRKSWVQIGSGRPALQQTASTKRDIPSVMPAKMINPFSSSGSYFPNFRQSRLQTTLFNKTAT